MNKTSKNLYLFILLLLILLFILITIKNQDTVSNEEETKSDRKIINWALNYVGNDSKKEREPVRIAILDSGINKNQKEFEGLIFKEFNAIKSGGEIYDDFGHGTAIAGIIAAHGYETTGVIHNVVIYDVKVLNEKGGGKIEDVIEGIEWSIEQEVDIINISFGFSSDRDGLEDVVKKAIDQNIIIVAASGNTLGLTVDYPANYNNVLSISSFDENFQLDPYSAVGKIDYTAPGVNIISTDNKGGYSTFSGTSFATAYATGGIASVLNNSDKSLQVKSIKDSLSNYVLSLGEKKQFGEGFITLRKEKVKEFLDEKQLN